MNIGITFIQMTFDRLLPVVPINNYIVVTSIQYKELVIEQLPEIPKENILCEPFRRNTAPWIYSRDPKGKMIVEQC